MAVMMKKASMRDRVAHEARVYVLVSVAEGFSDNVASILRCKPGVVMADVVEGQTNVVMVVEARHRLRLAQLTIQALAAVESMTDNVHLLPADKSRTQMVCK
jgi:hypothetical protein